MSNSSIDPRNDPFSSPGAQRDVPLSEKMRHSKALFPTIAVLAVAVAALGATLVVHQSNAKNADQLAMTQPPVMSPAATVPAPAATGLATAPFVAAKPATPVTAPAVAPASPPVARVAPQPVCNSCGTVESVVAVQRTAKPSGVGMVAGGVLGAVVGNQFGHGNGRTAMTVLGAGGGAYAGNAVEKNMKKYTVYEMRVRMEDGSTRTFEKSNALAAGTRVIVEGNTLRAA